MEGQTCPKCGSKKIARILYGLPDFIKIKKEVEEGSIVLGGCCVLPWNPSHRCRDCGEDIYSPSAEKARKELEHSSDNKKIPFRQIFE